MFERRLTDIAGGNLSARDGDWLYITPTRAGQKDYWNLAPEQLLHVPIATDDLLADPRHSKESVSHLAVYRAFPEVGAVIHAHPFHLKPYLASGKIPPTRLLAARLYGELAYIPDLPLYSAEQGVALVEALASRRETMQRFAAALLLPLHGVFIAGHDLDACIDCLERIDDSAYTDLASRSLD